MIISDGYALRQEIINNRIVITLPQTWSTISNTVNPICNRKLELSESDEVMLLSLIRYIYENQEDNECQNI